MRKDFAVVKVVFIVVSFFFNVVSLAQVTLEKQDKLYIGKIVRSFETSSGGTLDIKGISGDVTITGWDKNEVLIHEIKKMDVFTESEARAGLQQCKTNYRKSGNVIFVRGHAECKSWICNQFDIKVSSKFNIVLSLKEGNIELNNIVGSYRLNTGAGNIKLTNLRGQIIASTSGGNMYVQEIKGELHLNTSGGNIELRDVSGPGTVRTSGGDIQVRGCYGRLTMTTLGGDITIKEVEGPVNARTSGGNIQIEHVKESIDVLTSGGDIEVNNVTGNVIAHTSGGDVKMSDINGDVVAETSGGEIDLDEIKGTVRAKTSGGDIRVVINPIDFKRRHSASITASDGDLVLFLPAELPATIEATIEIYLSQWEEFNVYSDFPLLFSTGRDKDKKHRRARVIYASGSINGGGDRIVLHTINGSIEIKKL